MRADKSDRSYRERRLDFVFAARLFEGLAVEFVDHRHDCGELRMVAVGLIEGKLYKVVYTGHAGSRRIISVNRASRQERKSWQLSA
ncbi:BrnT family toxin [Lichenifustis flavocetrariae]|uniref:BrnT family toxin n=1 Tax=Lichenifustis flavocetrariae TaxID=2949735 RepID=UPI003D12A2E9